MAPQSNLRPRPPTNRSPRTSRAPGDMERNDWPMQDLPANAERLRLTDLLPRRSISLCEVYAAGARTLRPCDSACWHVVTFAKSRFFSPPRNKAMDGRERSWDSQMKLFL